MSFHPGETILAVMEELQNIMENQETILKNSTKSYHKCFDAFIKIIFELRKDIFLFTIPARKILQPDATLLRKVLQRKLNRRHFSISFIIKNVPYKTFNSCNLCPRGRCHAWLEDPKFLSAYWDTRIIALPNDGLQKTHSSDFSGPRDASGSSGYGGQSTSGSPSGSKPSRSGSVYVSSQGSSSKTVPKWFRGTTGKDHRK